MNFEVKLNDLSRALDKDRLFILEVTEKLIDNGLLVLGPMVRKFEKELSEFLNIDGVITVASGTDALEIALKACMPSGKRTVLTAANAGGYCSVAAVRSNFEVVYADIDPNTQSINLESLEDSISDEVGVVVVTHLYGLATDITQIVDYCHTRGIAVVEDCAQALGAKLPNGKFAGTQADVGTTSFYPTKNLGALGDGGAIFSADKEILDKVKKLRQYGWGNKYEIDISAGTNSRLDEFQAGILSFRLKSLESNNQVRRNIISRYRNASLNTSICVFPANDSSHTGHLAVATSNNRTVVRKQLSELGVQTDIHYPVPDHLQQGLFNKTGTGLPITEKMSSQIFTLPCFPELTEAEISHVEACLRNIQ